MIHCSHLNVCRATFQRHIYSPKCIYHVFIRWLVFVDYPDRLPALHLIGKSSNRSYRFLVVSLILYYIIYSWNTMRDKRFLISQFDVNRRYDHFLRQYMTFVFFLRESGYLVVFAVSARVQAVEAPASTRATSL